MHNFSDMLLLFSSHSLISLCSTIVNSIIISLFVSFVPTSIASSTIALKLHTAFYAKCTSANGLLRELMKTFNFYALLYSRILNRSFSSPLSFHAQSCFHHHSFPFLLVHSYIHCVPPIFPTAVHPTNLARVFEHRNILSFELQDSF